MPNNKPTIPNNDNPIIPYCKQLAAMPALGTRRAFTLIEVLVSLMVVVIIISAVYASWFAACRTELRCRDSIISNTHFQGVVNLIARQIRCSYAPESYINTNATSVNTNNISDSNLNANINDVSTNAKVNINANNTDTVTTGTDIDTIADNNNNAFVAYNWFYGNSADDTGFVLRFVTTAPAFSDKNTIPGLYIVTYKYDYNNHSLLYNQTNLYKANYHNTQPLTSNKSPLISVLPSLSQYKSLLRNVMSFKLAFYDGHKWQQQWHYNQRGKLPKAVKLDITFLTTLPKDNNNYIRRNNNHSNYNITNSNHISFIAALTCMSQTAIGE